MKKYITIEEMKDYIYLSSEGKLYDIQRDETEICDDTDQQEIIKEIVEIYEKHDNKPDITFQWSTQYADETYFKKLVDKLDLENYDLIHIFFSKYFGVPEEMPSKNICLYLRRFLLKRSNIFGEELYHLSANEIEIVFSKIYQEARNYTELVNILNNPFFTSDQDLRTKFFNKTKNVLVDDHIEQRKISLFELFTKTDLLYPFGFKEFFESTIEADIFNMNCHGFTSISPDVLKRIIVSINYIIKNDEVGDIFTTQNDYKALLPDILKFQETQQKFIQNGGEIRV